MKIEIINCDRCGTVIPDGPPNIWFGITIVANWTMNIANVSQDMCANCRNDYSTFMSNQVVNPR